MTPSLFTLSALLTLLTLAAVPVHAGSDLCPGPNAKRSRLSPLRTGMEEAGFSNTTSALEKRDITWFSFYHPEEGGQATACGTHSVSTDYIVALNKPQFESGSHCFEKINIHYKGKTVSATIVDECVGCLYNDLDLTPAIFTALSGSTDAGCLYYGTWEFAGKGSPDWDDGDKASKSSSSTSTSTSSPEKASTTSTASSTSTTKISSTSTPTSTSASTTADAPTQIDGAGVFGDLENVWIGLGELLIAGVGIN